MNQNQFSSRVDSTRVPAKYFIVSGSAQSDGTSKEGAFHLALIHSGLENIHSRCFTSFLPKECSFMETTPMVGNGQILDALVCQQEGVRGEQISAGIMTGILVKKSSRERVGTLVSKLSGHFSQEELREKLQALLFEIYAAKYEESYALDAIELKIESAQIEKEYGSVVVAIAFTEHEALFSPASKKICAFMGEKRELSKANYVFIPVESDLSSCYNKGTKEGVSAILHASQNIEDYDIETDSQPVKAGFHTLQSLAGFSHEAERIYTVQHHVKSVLEKDQFPVVIGGDSGISLGSLMAAKEFFGEFTVLHLDAHTDLRPSFDGSIYNEACVMNEALKITDHIVHVGIRSISNREKGEIRYDSLFFSQDIQEADELWVDDVLQECTEFVYITLDADVFDPSIMHSASPEPGGLNYHQVMKLIKKLFKSKQVIGMDFTNLVPLVGNNAPELMAAKIIYQAIAFREMFGKKRVLDASNLKASKKV